MPDRRTAAAMNAAPDWSPGARTARTRRTDPGAAPRQTAASGPTQGTGRPAEPIGERESIEDREPFPAWPPRDFLAPFVLLAVSLQRAHGYVIEDYLRALGLFGITMSTLYRTLRQMEKDGFLESTWEPGPTGPARRVYTITDAGHVWLESSASMLNTYRETIDRFFGLYDAGPRTRRQQPEGPIDEDDKKETER